MVLGSKDDTAVSSEVGIYHNSAVCAQLDTGVKGSTCNPLRRPPFG